MFTKADEVAQSLVEAGIKKGDEIPVCLSNTPELVYIMLAANKIGAKLNLFSSHLDKEYISEILDNCSLKLFIGTDDTYEEIKEIISDDEIGIDDLIGYEIADGEKENVIGKIEMIDETTENMLFIVKTNSGEYIYIPIAEELILEVDCDNAIILMDLPQGLISLQSK